MRSFSYIFRSELIRNAGNLLSASVVAQLIGLLVYPLLTQLYSPDDFGLLTLFLQIGNVLVMLTTMEYHYAIVLPDNEQDAQSVMRLCFRLLALSTIVVAVSVLFRDPIAALFNSPDLARFYPLMPLMVFALGGWNMLNYWYIRRKAFSRISGYQYVQSVFSAGGKLGFGYGHIFGGMIYSVVLAPVLACLVSVSLAFKKHVKIFGESFESQGIRKVAARYRNFPLYTLPRDVVNIVAAQLPVFVLTPCFGAYDVGLWSMAMLLGFVPINMITKAIYQVLYQDCAERVNTHRAVWPLIRSFSIYALILLVPLFAGLFFILPWLTSWLLGAEWMASGHMIRWMLPWLLMTALTASTCFLSDIFMQQKLGLVFEILLAVCRFAGVGIGVVCGSFTVAIAGYCIGSSAAIFAQFIWLISLCRKHDQSLC